MHVWLRNEINTEPHRMDAAELCAGGDFWQPVIVGTHEEKDYLASLCLLVGKPMEVCVDGVDKPVSDTPPVWVSIPHLAQ